MWAKQPDQRGDSMLSGLMDRRNSMVRRFLGNDKADPGAYSFLQPGWWALHATAITALYVMAQQMSKKDEF